MRWYGMYPCLNKKPQTWGKYSNLWILLTWNRSVNVLKNVWKLCTSSKPNRNLTFLNIDIPKTAKINITRKRRRHILRRAGKAMTSENNNVRISLAPLIRRNTRPTFATRTWENINCQNITLCLLFYMTT